MEAVPDDGYAVDLARLGGVAGEIGLAYDDLTTAITQYGQQAPAPGDLGSEVAGSWSDFDGAWAQELNVYGLALTELARKVHAAGVNYAAADSATIRDVDSAGG